MNAELGGASPKASLRHKETWEPQLLKSEAVHSAACGLLGLGF